jgi:LEA14-like dessication related protein
MKHSIIKLLLLLFTMTLISCAELAKHADTIKPTAKLTGTRLANINFEQVDLVFDLAVDNKNPVSLNLAGLDYELKIENQSLVSGTTAQAIQLKASSTSPVQLPITLKFNDLKNLPGELWNKDQIAYQLISQFNVDLPVIGNYAIPVTSKGELPVPKIPDIKIKDVKVNNLSFTSADLIAQVEVSNPNDFDLGLSNLNYQLTVNQQNWGQGKINQNSSIPKKGKGLVEIPVKLNMLSAGKSAYNALVNKAAMEYQLTGNVTVDTGLELLKKQNIPLDIKGTTSIR